MILCKYCSTVQGEMPRNFHLKAGEILLEIDVMIMHYTSDFKAGGLGHKIIQQSFLV